MAGKGICLSKGQAAAVGAGAALLMSASFPMVVGAGVLGWLVGKGEKEPSGGYIPRRLSLPREHFDDWPLNNLAAELLGAARKVRREQDANPDAPLSEMPTHAEYVRRLGKFDGRYTAVAADDPNAQEDNEEFQATLKRVWAPERRRFTLPRGALPAGRAPAPRISEADINFAPSADKIVTEDDIHFAPSRAVPDTQGLHVIGRIF